jgi:hypothetical protein
VESGEDEEPHHYLYRSAINYVRGKGMLEVSTNAMIDQRLDYIPMNPVKECIVYEPEHYVYSSARYYTGERGLIEVEFL